MSGASKTLYQAARRAVCWLRGHAWHYFESVPRGAYFLCFRCGAERAE